MRGVDLLVILGALPVCVALCWPLVVWIETTPRPPLRRAVSAAAAQPLEWVREQQRRLESGLQDHQRFGGSGRGSAVRVRYARVDDADAHESEQ